ncbi:hypothetical protein BU25DRAFT_412589 [Macroventuria anomochaeta]|uniref:Uncharacterized protein n=1 Tax=Macroventuria anomochaeta TaxID=301207 RepID=A0ACB6RVW2_9PLEO|nr:uncharacterized protein BU25DRAFT_412589 [Macroventuria anomochaeta]KAF2625555.1 hypothetical protein BU25DRAFT_412589 [Macroventuria anomochaeta]
MAYRKRSQYISHSRSNQTKEPAHSSKYPEQFDSLRHYYSRSFSPDHDIRTQPPRRRRWAAGYMDRPSCPSYSYINTRSHSPGRSPDHLLGSDYITQPRSREDEYIQSRERHDNYAYSHSTYETGLRPLRDQIHTSRVDLVDNRSVAEEREVHYGSDIEDLDEYQHTQQRDSRSASYDSEREEGSDLVNEKRRSMGSDVASIHSRRSSNSRSDQRSITSLGVRSDVQKRRRSVSASDSEGGYISLDEYIAGRSDCVSDRSLSEDEGEGSDAVGSDIEGASDVGEGSDVASLSAGRSYDDGEDCIDNGCDAYMYGYRRR